MCVSLSTNRCVKGIPFLTKHLQRQSFKYFKSLFTSLFTSLQFSSSLTVLVHCSTPVKQNSQQSSLKLSNICSLGKCCHKKVTKQFRYQPKKVGDLPQLEKGRGSKGLGQRWRSPPGKITACDRWLRDRTDKQTNKQPNTHTELRRMSNCSDRCKRLAAWNSVDANGWYAPQICC